MRKNWTGNKRGAIEGEGKSEDEFEEGEGPSNYLHQDLRKLYFLCRPYLPRRMREVEQTVRRSSRGPDMCGWKRCA